MFASQPESEATNVANKNVSSSCPAKIISKWIMVFEWDEDVEKPFQTLLSSNYKTEIKEAWLTSTLSSKSRTKKLVLDGKSMSLFGKMNSSK